MSTAAAPDRIFPTFPRGEVREDMLASFRVGLRALTNPDTGAPFLEDEIAVATSDLSRWYDEADAIDLVLLSAQGRSSYLVDQFNPATASTAFLEGYHGPMWALPRLGASGGSGPVTAPGVPGTTFVGSTTVGDPAATYGTDPKGLKYQVLFTETVAIGQTSVALTLIGIDTGTATNILAGTKIHWANGPLGANGDALVTTDFQGGFAEETDGEWAQRILDAIRHKQAAGNNAQMRSWARSASVAVEDAFVYACAFNAGSVLVAITQRRGAVQGPTGRIPSVGTMALVVARITPPASPVVPLPPHVVALPVVGKPSNLVLSLALPTARSSGWTDAIPWPQQSGGTAATITLVTTQQDIKIEAHAALPSGVTLPSLMVWNAVTSRFEKMLVATCVLDAGTVYHVTLTAPPGATLTAGDFISPGTARLDLLGQSVEAYLDTLGPGEVVNLTTSVLAHRAFRYPEPQEQFPQRCGSSVIGFLQDAFGATLSDGQVESVTLALPAVPADPISGPNLIVAGKVGCYSL